MSEYILGDADPELRRLEEQHVIWRDDTGRLLDRAGFSPGDELLDIGCGPGLTTLDLADRVGPSGRVRAVDASPRMLEVLGTESSRRGRQNILGIKADVERLPDDLDPVDGVFARWVLCFLREPEAVIEAAARVLRRGGRFVVMDYFNYLAIALQPSNRLFARVYEAVFESFDNPGGGLEVGRRIPELFVRHGIAVNSVEPICGIGRPGTPIWRWLSEFQENFLPTLVDRGFLTAPEFEEYMALWKEVSARPDAFLFAPPMLGVVGIKA